MDNHQTYTADVAAALRRAGLPCSLADAWAREFVNAHPEKVLSTPPERAALECAWTKDVRQGVEPECPEPVSCRLQIVDVGGTIHVKLVPPDSSSITSR